MAFRVRINSDDGTFFLRPCHGEAKKGDEAARKKKLREACHVNNCRRLTLVVHSLVTQRG